MNEPAVYLPPERPIERVDKPEEPETFTSKEVVAMTGVTYRQLDWWARNGYIEGQIVGPGSGKSRQWLREDVVRVVEIRDAIRRTMSILAEVGLPADTSGLVGHYGGIG